MPSDSVAGFLDRAQATRVLIPEQVEQLIRQPDIPKSDLVAFCDYLLTRKVMTRFQADAILESRADQLSFAGYTLVDDLGPCPGGRAYRSLHPSLRTPVVVRRINPNWLEPNDTVHGYLNRAKTFGMINHPGIVPLLDAGLFQDLYLVLDQPRDAANLEELAKEVGGAMPGFLAAEYGRAIASALAAVHAKGGFHGEVRPANLLVGPLVSKKNSEGVEKKRPAPNASVRLMEVGLVPLRPPVSQYGAVPGVLAYLAPERLETGVPEPASDIYGLGATLYFLLAGRVPYEGTDVNEIAARLRSGEPAPLAALRPDLPRDMVAFVGRLMHKQIESRPGSATEVEAGLAAFCRTPSKAVPASPGAVHLAENSGPPSGEGEVPVVVIPLPEEEVPAAEAEDFWGGSADLEEAHSTAEKAPRKREMSEDEKKRSRRLLILGGLLHATWITLLVVFVIRSCTGDSKPSSEPTQPKQENKQDKDKSGPAKKNKKQNTLS